MSKDLAASELVCEGRVRAAGKPERTCVRPMPKSDMQTELRKMKRKMKQHRSEEY